MNWKNALKVPPLVTHREVPALGPKPGTITLKDVSEFAVGQRWELTRNEVRLFCGFDPGEQYDRDRKLPMWISEVDPVEKTISLSSTEPAHIVEPA
jgi:hypothetical protein